MAKAIRKVGDPVATEVEEGGISVTLPKAICKDREVMRWLNHWVVDAVADRGHVDWMAGAVEVRLENLATDIVVMFVADLVRQAIEATSKTKEAQPQKKAAKRTGK